MVAEPVMKKVKGDGVEINLAVWEGSGKPILLELLQKNID